MKDEARPFELKSLAQSVRAKVQEALKTTAEREVIDYEPDFMGHSSKVTQLEPDAAARQADDESLASSLWGSESDDRIRDFAERLAKAKAPETARKEL